MDRDVSDFSQGGRPFLRVYIVLMMGAMVAVAIIMGTIAFEVRRDMDRPDKAVRNIQSQNLPLYQAEIERCEAAGGKPLFAVEFWGDGDGRLAASMDSPLRTADGNIACLRDAALIDQRPR